MIDGGLLKLSNMAGYGDLVTRVIERVPLVAQELLTFPEDPSSHPDYRVVHSLVFYAMLCRSLFVHFTFGPCIVCSSIYGF